MRNAKIAEVIERFSKDIDLAREKDPRVSVKSTPLTIAQANFERIARALRDEVGLSPRQIAEVLYDRNGLGLCVENVVEALYNIDGLDLNAEDVASVMCDLLSTDGKTNLKEVISSLLNGTEMDESKIAQTLTSKSGPNRSAEEFICALHDLGYGTDALAGILYDAFGLSAKEIARILYQGIGDKADASEVASALKDGLGVSDNEVASAMKYVSDYVSESLTSSLRENGMNMEDLFYGMYVICRSHADCVYAGEFLTQENDVVVLQNARRLLSWTSTEGESLSRVAADGLADYGCKIDSTVPMVRLTGVIETIACTDIAEESIRYYRNWPLRSK